MIKIWMAASEDLERGENFEGAGRLGGDWPSVLIKLKSDRILFGTERMETLGFGLVPQHLL